MPQVYIEHLLGAMYTRHRGSETRQHTQYVFNPETEATTMDRTSWLPRTILYGELQSGERQVDRQHLHYKDICKQDLQLNEPGTTEWETLQKTGMYGFTKFLSV